MTASLRGILWTWFVLQCYCCMVVTVSYKTWYSDIPQEIFAAQKIFPFLENATIVAVILALMAMHLAAHIVLVVRRDISFVMFSIFLFLPWLVSYMAFLVFFPFFNGPHYIHGGV